MSSSCTIISTNKGCISVLAELKHTKYECKILGENSEWDEIVIVSPNGKLIFKRLIRLEPGDKFSKLILGMHNWFNRIDTKYTSTKKIILDRIAKAEMLIGVVGEPKFIEEEGHYDKIFNISRKLSGIIFNGDAMISSKGEMLLNKAGNSETGNITELV